MQPSSIARRETESLAEELETVPCPLCGGTDAKLRFRACDRLYGRPGDYALVECNACSLNYVNPRPTLAALGVHYPSDYFASAPPEKYPMITRQFHQFMLKAQARGRLRATERAIGKLPPGTRAVDVGCGLNELVAQMIADRGADAVGVEFSPSVVEYVRTKPDRPIVQGTLQSAGFRAGEFDLVTMIEYLEHEPNPGEVLAEARRITKPNGHLVIEIPHIAGLPARMFGSRWATLDVPRHLVFFTPETLERMLAKFGYRLIHVRPFSLPLLIGLSVATSLGYRRLNSINTFERIMVALVAMPFVPFLNWLPEFVFAVAKAE
jgi:SAM-dependent methyltransferase